MTLRISDMNGNVLAVNVHDILNLLTPKALLTQWIVSPVTLSNGESWFEVIGEGSAELDALADNGQTIDGESLLALTKRCKQIIWGQFRSMPSDNPWLTIKAVDSTFYEIETEDKEVLKRISEKYSDVVFQ